MRHSLLLALGCLCLSVASAPAAILTVNSDGDGPDASPGDGVCETAPGNFTCTLRAAIQEANALAGLDSIVFSGVFTIDLGSDLPPVLQPTEFLSGAIGNVEIVGHGRAGLDLAVGNSSVFQFVINGCSTGLILRTQGNNINSCFIGTATNGVTARPNDVGLLISNCSSNFVGGFTVISGNSGDGVRLEGNTSIGNRFLSCRIGTDASGSNAVGNAGNGLHFVNAGSVSVENSVVSGNGQNGILVEGGRLFRLDYSRVGTDVSGTVALSNGLSGLVISNAVSCSVTPFFSPTVISGNGHYGIEILGSGATSNQVGGLDAIFIGADIQTNALGNGLGGVLIGGGASGNKIASTLDPVIIGFNGGPGVTILSGTNNTVGNSAMFLSNAGLAIDLGGNGPTPNDNLDPDEGANHLLNHPVLTAATSDGSGTVIMGSINSTAFTSLQIDLYTSSNACQAETFLESVFVFTLGDGNASFTRSNITQLATGSYVTALTKQGSALNFQENVSEFAPCVQVNAGSADLTITMEAAPDPVEVQSNLTYTVTVHNIGPDPATGVAVLDLLPPNVEFVSASGGCAPSGDTVTCNVGNLASGAMTSLTITVRPTQEGTLTNDVSVTANETDSNPGNNTARTLTAVGLPIVEFAMETFTVRENDGMATVTIVRRGNTDDEVSVHFSTSFSPCDEECNEDIPDYLAVDTDVSFAPGETSQTVTITIRDDALNPEAEFSGRVDVLLTNPTGGAQLGALREAVVLVKDNEPPEISIDFPFPSPDSRNVFYENLGPFHFPVFRRGDIDVPVSVEFNRKNGTAKEFIDYGAIGGTLQFGAGEDEKEIIVTPIDNAVADGDRYFFLNLSNPQPAGVTLAVSGLVIVISDDDVSPAGPKTATVTDSDGDGVTGSIKGNGSVQIQPASTNGAGLGQFVTLAAASGTPFDIILSGTDAATALTIKVSKGAAGDGLANINSIVSGGGLKSISAKGADLTGDGIFLGGPLGSLTIHDILDGADVLAGGASGDLTTKFTAHVIGDDSTIALGSAIKSFSAASIGQSEIFAPALGKVSVKGDKKLGIPGNFGADVDISGEGVLPGTPALGALTVGNAISNSMIFALGNIGKVSAARILDSAISAGFEPIDLDDPLAGGFFEPGLTISSVATKAPSDSFVNSILAAAQIGTVKLSSVQTNNSGLAFGVLADESINSVTVTTPAFQYDPAGSTNQSVGDFHVILP